MREQTKTLKTFEEISEFFAAFPGMGIQVWSYTISHSILDFAISHKKKPDPKLWAKDTARICNDDLPHDKFHDDSRDCLERRISRSRKHAIPMARPLLRSRMKRLRLL